MRLTLFLLPVIMVATIGCNGYSEQKLMGNWRGVGVMENDIPLDIDPAEIKFQFLENGLYSFQSTLNYREAGTFKIAGDLLYTLDTINKASSEKAVRVMMLSSDSLYLKMQAEGEERMLKMVREK